MKPSLPTLADSVRTLFIATSLLLGGFAYQIVWLGVALRLDSRAGWMAPGAALIAISLLRMTGAPSGRQRGQLAMLATAAYLALGEWLVACLPIAETAGLSPPEAAQRMGADFGWMLIQLGNTPLDWGWIVIALAIAARFGR